jgi:ribonuclease HepT-like protein
MNSSAWDKFRKQQATERQQLQRLLLRIQPLLTQCSDRAPTEIELSALAATLHSFYTGAENIFKRVALELDGEPVCGDAWHRELLRRMKMPTAHRPALLSEELHGTLLE